MNDFDRAARCAVKECPLATLNWLFPGLKATVRYRGWLDAQSAPRPGEPDRRCDTIAELTDDEGLLPPWAAVIELFTEADGDALDRAIEYVGRFRRALRHGPHGRDRYRFAIALVFLTDAPPETALTDNLPGMEEVGMWFGPRVLDVSAESAVAHLEAVEQNRQARGLLAWVPRMMGGQTEEVVRRWRALVETEPEVGLRNTLVDVALVFAQLTDSREVWRKGLEGVIMNESISMREVRVETRRQDTLELLEENFPGGVPRDVVERIKAETDFSRLGKWLKLAGKADLEGLRADMG